MVDKNKIINNVAQNTRKPFTKREIINQIYATGEFVQLEKR